MHRRARATGWRAFALGLLGLLGFGSLGGTALGATAGNGSAPFRAGTVIVGFRPAASAAQRTALERGVGAQRALGLMKASQGTTAARELGQRLGPVFALQVPRGHELAAVRWLRNHSASVRFAEPDYLMQASGATRVPNDPSFGLQWGSLNIGQTVDGVNGVAGDDDRAAQAWSITTGSRSIVVGITDTGLDYRHPDLSGNVWSNPGHIGGCKAGTHGYNVVAGSCDPMDDDTEYNGHGTHVAGIIGAVGNNSTGVAGMNWTTTLLPVKWLNSQAWGTTSQLISALDWLVKTKQAGVNVRVVNDSATFVGTAYSQALSDEIDLLGANGILFVTAAGNTSDNNDDASVRRYPCGYDRPTEICVTASNQSDALPSWANYGPNTVDLAAPGDNIYSTLRGGGYGYISGGSMAAAQVSGAAALILSADNMSTTALKSDILGSVDPEPALSGLVRTGGVLDVCKAIPGCGQSVAAPVNTAPPTVSGSPVVGQTLTAAPGTWSNSPTSYSYSWQRCDASGSNCGSITGATATTYVLQSADAGSTIRVTVTAVNTAGSSAATSAATAVASTTSTTGTFGTAAVGTSSDTFAADRKRVNAYSLPVNASVSKLSMYLTPAGSGQQVLEGLIYSDSGGSPANLLATTAQLTFSSTQSAGWYDLRFASPISLPAGRYWIGVITGGTGGVAGFRYTSLAGSRDYNSNSFASGPTSTFGSFTTDGEQMSLYATYTSG